MDEKNVDGTVEEKNNCEETPCLEDNCNSNNFIDEQNEETKKRKKFTKKNLFFLGISAVSAFLICNLIYMNFFMWNPSERDFCDDNLYLGYKLTITPDELDDITKILEETLGIKIEEQYKDEYALLYAVLENDNLTEEEKKVFYKFVDIIIDNPYVDRQSAFSALRNLTVERKCRPYYFDDNVVGSYNYERKCIGIFTDDKNSEILEHEGIHAIYCNKRTKDLPEFFIEGVTELLTNEYFDENPFLELKTYPFEIAAVKMLCEVTSSDTVLKAFSLGSMDIIAQEMVKYNGDIERSRHSLVMLEKLFKKRNGELEEELSYVDIIEGFINTFSDIVTARYNSYNKYDRVSLMAFSYNWEVLIQVCSEDSYHKYIDILNENGAIRKYYFSEKGKAELADRANQYSNSQNENEKTYKKSKNV